MPTSTELNKVSRSNIPVSGCLYKRPIHRLHAIHHRSIQFIPLLPTSSVKLQRPHPSSPTMLFSKFLPLAGLPFLVAGAALPAVEDIALEARANCVVNARQRDLWVEAGLSRWRTVFSAEGTDPGKFCHYWFDRTLSPTFSNP
jgi:hypothetical protein